MGYVRAKKHLGQHFLVDKNLALRIVESVEPGPADDLLEVGPGTGILTRILDEKYGNRLKAIEIDYESVQYLVSEFPTLSGKIIQGDFLRLDLSTLFQNKFAIIGNFPYNISSQIFFKILDYRDRIPMVVGMLQKEVALRICSGPGSKEYGILSVFLQTYYDISYLFSVPPQVFSPPPKVSSAVIRLIRNTRENPGCDEMIFRKIVKASFNQRRKILKNSLASAGIDVPPDFAMQRPEQLTVDDFILLSRLVQEKEQGTILQGS